MENKHIEKTKFKLLTKEKSSVNKKGKPTGKERFMLNSKGLAIGTKNRLEVNEQILYFLESLLENKCHFVLQTSEGDSIKIVGPDGMTRCVILIRSGCLQTFNLRAGKEKSKTLLKNAGFKEQEVNIRNISKSKYVYTDFENTSDYKNITKFILSLPPSYQCFCGHTNDPESTKINKTKNQKEKQIQAA